MGPESPLRRRLVTDVVAAAASCGYDFGRLHPALLLDVVATRVDAWGVTGPEYVDRLMSDPVECMTIRRSVLATRPSFFDDPPAWLALSDHLKNAWRDLPSDSQVRVWVPGCGSGEEALTVAMLVSEVLGDPVDLSARLRVLATDLDDAALDHARRGRYPQSLAASMPDKWAKKHLTIDRGLVTVCRNLSDSIVLAHHDIARDPAFLELDLVVLRRVLGAYLPQVQYDIVGALHHSLRPGGSLVLGRDDNLSRIQEIFREVDPASGVYLRSGIPVVPMPAGARRIVATQRPDAHPLIEHWLRASVSTCIVVDNEDRVVELFGDPYDSDWLRPTDFDGRLATLLHPDLLPVVRRAMAGARRGVTTVGGVAPTVQPCMVRATAFDTPQGRMVGVALLAQPTDAAGVRENADLVDPATGLLNRTGFMEHLAGSLEVATRSERTCGLLWIDIDRFSEINDDYGHEAGDQALAMIADRLRDVCAERGYIGRLSGDQFGMVVLRVGGIHDLLDFADALSSQIRRPLELPLETIRLTASIGAALATPRLATSMALLRAADRAMYAAKEAGGDRIEPFSLHLEEQIQHRAELGQALARALRQADFTMYYQPIVHARDHRVWGVEALLRWHRGDDVVPAGAFIEEAMKTGQIRDLGRRVVELVADDFPALLSALPPGAKVCINLSVPELEDWRIIDLLHVKLPPAWLSRLVVEVTESALLGNERLAVSTLESLHSRGVGISLDDFGTGYSNLGTLDLLLPEVIKADKSFLELALELGGQRKSLLGVVPAITAAVGAISVAEGISDRVRWQEARQAGFDLLQGFLLARPMPVDELAHFTVCVDDS